MAILVQWSELPVELLELIASRLLKSNFIDYIRFGAVCKSWRSVYQETPKTLPPQIPWLMLYLRDNNESRFRFFSISNSKFDLIDSPSRRRFCCGSSQGWLFMANEETLDSTLINPITGSEIPLPCGTTLPWVLGSQISTRTGVKEYILWWCKLPNTKDIHHISESRLVANGLVSKLVLSSHPTLNSENCVIMAMDFGFNRLVFCKPGDPTWTAVKEDKERFYTDIAYWQGKFYAIDNSGRFVVFQNVDGPSPTLKRHKMPKTLVRGSYHLVESSGDLLLIRRHSRMFDRTHPQFDNFQVFKLTPRRWSKLKSLGNHTLFLSPRSSFSVLSTNYPGLKGNCIYFINPDFEGKCGIYNLDNHNCEPFYTCNTSFEPFNVYNRANDKLVLEAVWITPSLW